MACQVLPERPSPAVGRTAHWFSMADQFGFPVPEGTLRGTRVQGRMRARGASVYLAVGSRPLKLDVQANTLCRLGDGDTVHGAQRVVDLGVPEGSAQLVALYGNGQSLPREIRVSKDDGSTWSKAAEPSGANKASLPAALAYAAQGVRAGQWFSAYGGLTLDSSEDGGDTWIRRVDAVGSLPTLAFASDAAGETLWLVTADISFGAFVHWIPLSAQPELPSWNRVSFREWNSTASILEPDPSDRGGVFVGGYQRVAHLRRSDVDVELVTLYEPAGITVDSIWADPSSQGDLILGGAGEVTARLYQASAGAVAPIPLDDNPSGSVVGIQTLPGSSDLAIAVQDVDNALVVLVLGR